MLSTNLLPHSDAKKCLLALAKYLSRLITTFYQKSTINITDLINKNDDLDYNNNLLAHEKGCHETCQKTL